MIQKICNIANESAKFIGWTSDLVNGVPTKTDCGPGSELTILDPNTKKIVDFFIFDGTNWYN